MFPASLWRPLHSKTLRRKCAEWIHRYGWAEFWSFSLSIVLTALSFRAFGNIIGSAFFGSIVQTVIFYGVIAFRDVRHRMRRDRDGFGALSVLKLFRNLVLEFGFAEYADSLIIRPFLFATLPLFIPHYAFAIVIGTLIADISYYVPVIVAYELRKKYLTD